MMSEYNAGGLFGSFIRFCNLCFSSRYRFVTLFFITLLVRFATFFVDYYYPDMIVSVLYRSGLNGGWHPSIHKGVVYTGFLDLSFWLFGLSARSLHIMAFFLTYLEGLGVYFLTAALGYSRKIAYFAAIIFVIVCSTALPEIMVPNGEQIFMLFFLWGFFCFVKAYFDKKNLYYLGVLFFLLLSLGAKQTGIWFPLSLLFFLYLDIINALFKKKRAILLATLLALIFGVLFGVGLLSYASHHPEIKSLNWLANAWDYIRSYPKFNVMKWVAVFFLVFCHPFLFLFPIANFVGQWKENNFTRRELFLYSVTFALFLSAFAGGTRLYQHYFFPLYPLFSIFCASFICRYGVWGKNMIKNIGGLSLVHIMILFGLYVYWALLVNPLLPLYERYTEFTPNSYSIFLYPNKMERETIAFIKEKRAVHPEIQGYIWPIGHVMGYFSKIPFKIGPYIDVADNQCLLYNSVKDCAQKRVDSFFELNKKGDFFIEYRGLLVDPQTFSSNPIKAAIQRSMSAHQGLFGQTEAFATEIDKEMEKRGAKRIFNVRNALYIWEKP